jgi:hypothetical protein
MSAQALQDYLGALQREYATGNPTEHTYRPALKTLLERLAPSVIATNEPKRLACGAPDDALTRASGYCPLTVGYVEAKYIGKLVPDIERTDQPGAGDNKVEAIRYLPPEGQRKGRVCISKTQYFEGVSPQVWEFRVGGYRVAEKWLKDRAGRGLAFEDLADYMDVVGVLVGTIRLMQEIDAAIPSWPLT